MPVVKTVSVTYGRKFNLGDFNSATIDCTFWADIEEGEDLNQVMKDLWEMAKNNVKAQSLPLVQKANMKVEEIFLGLPIEIKGDDANNNGS